MLILHSTKNTLIKVAYFLKMYYHTPFQYAELNGASVTSTKFVDP